MSSNLNPKIYEGAPCRHCGGTERLVSTKRCRPCSRNWVRQSVATQAGRDLHRGKPCGICAKPMAEPCFDHKPNAEPRGWLCHDCNKGVGWLNTPELLVDALAYLSGWGVEVGGG